MRGSTTLVFVVLVYLVVESVDSMAEGACSAPTDNPEMFFSKASYVHWPPPEFDATRGGLPSPIYDENPLWVKTYWKAWELAFRVFYEPDSGFVSQFIDAAYNRNVFLWDSAFITMFTNLATPLVPGQRHSRLIQR